MDHKERLERLNKLEEKMIERLEKIIDTPMEPEMFVNIIESITCLKKVESHDPESRETPVKQKF